MSLILGQPINKIPHSPKWANGFTLVEILVALAIAIILIAIAAPQFTQGIQQQHTASEINDLYNDLEYARSEAVKEGQMVTVCASTDGATCNGTTWQGGWIICNNPGWTSTTQNCTSSGSFTYAVLRTHPAFTTSDPITTTPASQTTVTYNRDGFSAGFSATTGLLFDLHSATTNTQATHCLWIDVLGRSYIENYEATLPTTGPAITNGQTTKCA